jgi:hypothetical protein
MASDNGLDRILGERPPAYETDQRAPAAQYDAISSVLKGTN